MAKGTLVLRKIVMVEQILLRFGPQSRADVRRRLSTGQKVELRPAYDTCLPEEITALSLSGSAARVCFEGVLPLVCCNVTHSLVATLYISRRIEYEDLSPEGRSQARNRSAPFIYLSATLREN